MNISFISQARDSFFHVMKETVIFNLSAHQKKASVIAITILAVLAVVLIYRHFTKTHSLAEKKVDVKLHREDPIDSLLSRSRMGLFSGIISAQKIDQIQSAKFFINIMDGHTNAKLDFIIKKVDHSGFDNDFLSEQLDRIFNDTKEKIKWDENQSIEILCVALLKDKNGVFYEVSIEHESKGNKFSSECSVALEDIKEFCDLTLKTMNREVTPQLNAQLEFI
jgi:hypothetical protein